MIDPTELADIRILVIGASGFLGRHLIRALDARGADVIAVSRNPSWPLEEGRNIHWVKGDVSERETAASFRHYQPEIIYHLTSDSRGGREIALVSPTLKNDVITTLNMLLEMAEAKPGGTPFTGPFIMTASLEEPVPASGVEPTPVSPYAAAKWATCGYGRMFKHLYGLDVRIVRPMMVFGPGQKPYKVLPSTILSLLKHEKAVIGSGSRLVDWIYVEDVIDAFIRAAQVPSFDRTLDLGSGTRLSVGAITTMIAERMGKLDLLEIGDGARGVEMMPATANVTASSILNWRASTPLPEAIDRTIAWYREHRDTFV